MGGGEPRVFLFHHPGHTSLLLHKSNWKWKKVKHFFSFAPNHSADILTHITTLQSPRLSKMKTMPQHHVIALPNLGNLLSNESNTMMLLKPVMKDRLYWSPNLEPARLEFLDRLSHYHSTAIHLFLLTLVKFSEPNFCASIIFALMFAKFFLKSLFDFAPIFQTYMIQNIKNPYISFHSSLL